MQKSWIKSQDGNSIVNNTADVYDGYGVLASTPQDGITSAFFPWAQMGVSITISGKEEMQNRGQEQALDLFQSKVMQAEASGKNLQNNCIVMGRLASGASGNLNQFVARVGKLDSGASGPNPLPALIDASPSRSVEIGNINGNTEAWWRNQALAFSGSTYAAYKQQKGRLYNNVSRGPFPGPDLILSDQRTWELYYNSLEAKERYVITDQRKIDILGGAGEDMLAYRGAIHIWDEIVPDVGTSTATPETENGKGDSVGSYLADGNNGTEYHICSDALEYIVHSARDWVTTPFVRPVGQDARTAMMLWMGQLVVNNRRRTGVLYDVTNTISA